MKSIKETLGKLISSEDSLKSAHEKYKKYPEAHLKGFIEKLQDLAQTYKYKDRLEDAIVLAEASLEICKAQYMKEPKESRKARITTVPQERLLYLYERSLRRLRDLYLDKRLPEKSLPLAEDYLEIMRKELLQEEQYVEKTTKKYMCKGYMSEAEEFKAKGFHENALLRYNDALFKIALIHIKLGNSEEALTCAKEFTLNEWKLDDKYRRSMDLSIILYKTLARCLSEEEQYQALQELLDLLKSIYAIDKCPDPIYEDVLEKMSHNQKQRGNIEEAVILYEEFFSSVQKRYWKDHVRLSEIYVNSLLEMASLYLTAKSYDKGVPLIKSCIQIVTQGNKTCIEDWQGKREKAYELRELLLAGR